MTEQISPVATSRADRGFGGLVLSSALLSAALTLVLLVFGSRVVPALAPQATVAVVTFDVLKFTNAQRAVASAFVKKDAGTNTAAEVLLNLSERTRAAISEVAGDGTLVVLKQSVVQGQTTDITDDVLRKLGLPTEVPTEDAAAYSLDLAPTLLSTFKAGAPSGTQTENRAPTPAPGKQQLP